jgi:hypothetical protein
MPSSISFGPLGGVLIPCIRLRLDFITVRYFASLMHLLEGSCWYPVDSHRVGLGPSPSRAFPGFFAIFVGASSDIFSRVLPSSWAGSPLRKRSRRYCCSPPAVRRTLESHSGSSSGEFLGRARSSRAWRSGGKGEDGWGKGTGESEADLRRCSFW